MSKNKKAIARRKFMRTGLTRGLSVVAMAGSVHAWGKGASAIKPISAYEVDRMLSQIKVCKLTPQAIQGPYFIGAASVRKDIRDGRPGLPMRLVLEVTDTNTMTCMPTANAAVSVWHCDADGIYSGYQSNDPNANPDISIPYPQPTDSQRFLRGTQISDKDGKVEFMTIFPGWYTPRTAHIHVKVVLNNSELITTQLYFEQAIVNDIYANHAAYKRRGLSPFTNENDLFIAQSGGAKETTLKLVKQQGEWIAVMRIGVAHA